MSSETAAQACFTPARSRAGRIDITTSHEFEREIMKGCEGIKPGWVRVNFNYFISEAAFQYLLDAVHFVADHGWKLLPHYRFDVASGQWRHRSPRPQPVLRLHDNSYRDGVLRYRSRHATEPEWVLPGYLDEARRIVDEAVAAYRPDSIDDAPLPAAAENLRWFPLPSEILAELTAGRAPTCGLPVHLAP